MRNVEMDTYEFRNYHETVAEHLFITALEKVPMETIKIDTPVPEAKGVEVQVLRKIKIAIVYVLGAGGMGAATNYAQKLRAYGFKVQEIWIGGRRDHETLNSNFPYQRFPEVQDADITIVYEPMCATGNSTSTVNSKIKEAGAKNIINLTVVASVIGIKKLSADHPDTVKVAAAVDDGLSDGSFKGGLNEAGYVVPGLGDAGDRGFCNVLH